MQSTYVQYMKSKDIGKLKFLDDPVTLNFIGRKIIKTFLRLERPK